MSVTQVCICLMLRAGAALETIPTPRAGSQQEWCCHAVFTGSVLSLSINHLFDEQV